MATSHVIPELDAKGLRSFGLTTAAIVAILFGLFLPWVFGIGLPVWPWILAAVLALWALVAPATLNPVYKGWMKVGLLMSKITTPIVLGLVFVLVIIPVGLVARVVRNDPLNRKLDPSATTYRVISEKFADDHFTKPF